MMKHTDRPYAAGLEHLIAENARLLDAFGSSVFYVPSGYRSLDGITGGFAYGELTVLGGLTSMGKTQFLVNVAVHLSKEKPVLFYTSDLSPHVLSVRFLSCLTGIGFRRLRGHDLTGAEQQLVKEQTDVLGKSDIQIVSGTDSDFGTFISECVIHIRENGTRVIIVDDLQGLLSGAGKEFSVSAVSVGLRRLAEDYHVAIICSTQIYRGKNLRYPFVTHFSLEELPGRGVLSQHAGQILAIYRPAYYGLTEDYDGKPTEGLAELQVLKNTNGPLGVARLRIDNNFCRFTDMEPC